MVETMEDRERGMAQHTHRLVGGSTGMWEGVGGRRGGVPVPTSPQAPCGRRESMGVLSLGPHQMVRTLIDPAERLLWSQGRCVGMGDEHPRFPLETQNK